MSKLTANSHFLWTVPWRLHGKCLDKGHWKCCMNWEQTRCKQPCVITQTCQLWEACFPVFHFRGRNALLIIFKREEMLPVSVVAAIKGRASNQTARYLVYFSTINSFGTVFACQNQCPKAEPVENGWYIWSWSRICIMTPGKHLQWMHSAHKASLKTVHSNTNTNSLYRGDREPKQKPIGSPCCHSNNLG